MPYHTGIRLLCVAQNPANGFPARLLDGGIPSFPVLFAICRTLRGAQAKQLGDVKVEGPVVLGTSPIGAPPAVR